MKGVVFNYLEEFVVENYGLEPWEKLLAKCPLKSGGVFVGPSTYPDVDFLAIVSAALKEFEMSQELLLEKFGKALFVKLARDFPVFLEGHVHPKSFLLSVESVIHVEVKKLMTESSLPEFIYFDTQEDQLGIEYRSKRRLCPLMKGILMGVAEHFKTDMNIEHPECLHSAGSRCLFSIEFGGQCEQRNLSG